MHTAKAIATLYPIKHLAVLTVAFAAVLTTSTLNGLAKAVVLIVFSLILLSSFVRFSSCINQRPQVVGGDSELMQGIMQHVPFLHDCPRLPLPGMLQLFIYALQMIWQEAYTDQYYEFDREVFSVTLPGESTSGFTDKVSVYWVTRKAHKGQDESSNKLPPNAPIILLTPGLNCYRYNLPGTAIYENLLDQQWRVGVFEKRGVGPIGERTLDKPVLHFFGHPSDLHEAIKVIVARWPEAPLHLVGMSSGNGLASSYVALHGREVASLRSCSCLIGGENYNCAFVPPKSTWLSRLVFDVVFLETCKSRFLRRNEEILRPHNAAGYEACLAARSLQELYDLCMEHFSGYSSRAEAESRINAFNDDTNECMRSFSVPFLVAFTEDDPVAPGGPRQEWFDVVAKCNSCCLALYQNGSHLGCYDSWRLTRWVDKLAVQWILAVEHAEKNR